MPNTIWESKSLKKLAKWKLVHSTESSWSQIFNNYGKKIINTKFLYQQDRQDNHVEKGMTTELYQLYIYKLRLIK